MKYIYSFFVFLLIYFLSIFCANSADLESAEQLYVKSGLEKQMMGIGRSLLNGYQNNYRKIGQHTAQDKKIYRNIDKIIEDSFDRQVTKKTVVDGLMKNINTSDIKLILAWLDSPIGRRITELEERASSKEGAKETQKYMRNIKNAPLSKQRIRLVKELDSVMEITRTTVDIVMSIQFALSMTTEEIEKKLNRGDIHKLYEAYKTSSAPVESEMKSQVYGSLLYTYQPLSDEELGQYVAFVKSAAGKKYSTVPSSFMLQAIIDSSLQFVWEIAQL